MACGAAEAGTSPPGAGSVVPAAAPGRPCPAPVLFPVLLEGLARWGVRGSSLFRGWCSSTGFSELAHVYPSGSFLTLPVSWA